MNINNMWGRHALSEVNVHLLTPDEVKALWPLAQVDDLVGAVVHPEDGYIQPADLTQALARGRAQRWRGDLPAYPSYRN